MGFVEEITEVDIETTVGIEYDDRPDADQSTSSAADESAHDDLATVQPRVTAGAETDSTAAAATAPAGVAPRAATSSTSQGTSTSSNTATASTNTASFASTATQADDSTAPQNPPQEPQGVT